MFAKHEHLRTFLTYFGPRFHIYTCMHAFARFVASHHPAKIHDVTGEHCAPTGSARISSPILVMCRSKVSMDCLAWDLKSKLQLEKILFNTLANKHLSTWTLRWKEIWFKDDSTDEKIVPFLDIWQGFCHSLELLWKHIQRDDCRR